MTRIEAHEAYGRVLTAAKKEKREMAVLRYLCLSDLFFLLVRVCGREDLDTDWHFARCMDVQREPDGYVDVWAREHGKMLSVDEPVPTPYGWVQHGDLEVGSVVYGVDGKPCKVIAVTPVEYDGECYEIFFKHGISIKAGAEHLWVVGQRSSKRVSDGKRLLREKKIMTTRDIYKFAHKPDRRLTLDVVPAVKGKWQTLLVDPYLMGAWLGDGTSSCLNITCAYKDIQIIDEIRKETPIKEVKSSNKNSGLFAFGNGTRGKKRTGLTPCFRLYGVLRNKHIPQEYLLGDIKQRLALLQGLMDTDGTIDTRGMATFTNTNERLIDDVYELCCSLGLSPVKRTKRGKFGGRPYISFDVTFQAYSQMPVFRLERKLKRQKPGKPWGRKYIVDCKKIPSEPMSCVQVLSPDGCYIVGRDFLPTHNSSIITFGKTIQDILLNAEERFGFFSNTRPLAKDHLMPIMYEFEENSKLKALFPDILYANPKRQARKWSEDDGFIVKRKGNYIEATVEASGLIDGLKTGAHYTVLVWDDIVNERSVFTPEQNQKTMVSFRASTNLKTQGGRFRAVGTYYDFFDPYVQIVEEGILKERKFAATDDGTEIGTPLYFSPEELASRRKTNTPYQFACQYLLNPKKGSRYGMEEDWLHYWKGGLENARGMNIYLFVDPANAKKKENDYTVITVAGAGGDGNLYVVEWVRDRLSLAERTAKLFDTHRRYQHQIKGVYYEEYGMQADIPHIKEKMEDINYRFAIQPVAGKTPKNDRINRIVPDFKEGRIYLPDECNYITVDRERVDLTKIFIREEYLSFPFGKHDDMLDSLARVKSPEVRILYPDKNASNANYIPDGSRRALTGYNPFSFHRKRQEAKI